ERRLRFKRLDDFARLERLARATGDQWQAKVFRQQLLFSHENTASVHQKSDLGSEWIGNLFVGSDPGDRLALDHPNVDFSRHLPHHLDFVDLLQLLQAILDMGEVYSKNIFAFAQAGCFQNLIALQRPIGLHFDLVQLIVRVLEEQTLRSELETKIKAGA